MNSTTYMRSVGTSISKADLFEKQVSALSQISRVLCRSENIEDTLSQVLAVLHDDVGMLHGLISISDSEHNAVQISAIPPNLIRTHNQGHPKAPIVRCVVLDCQICIKNIIEKQYYVIFTLCGFRSVYVGG